ncbi:MAG: HK97 gp10 family phage protein [Bacillota bacterium]|nr:HK97 gp10 family phage protein [Bacillota bacterium]
MGEFRYENLVDLQADLENLAQSLGNSKVCDILIDAMKPVEDAAISNAPSGRTGNLKNTIRTYAKVVKGSVFKSTTGNHRKDFPVSGENYYPAYVEYGHAGPKEGSGRTPPHPYLRPAFDLNKEAAFAKLGIGVSDVMKEHGL